MSSFYSSRKDVPPYWLILYPAIIVSSVKETSWSEVSTQRMSEGIHFIHLNEIVEQFNSTINV